VKELLVTILNGKLWLHTLDTQVVSHTEWRITTDCG